MLLLNPAALTLVVDPSGPMAGVGGGGAGDGGAAGGAGGGGAGADGEGGEGGMEGGKGGLVGRRVVVQWTGGAVSEPMRGDAGEGDGGAAGGGILRKGFVCDCKMMGDERKEGDGGDGAGGGGAGGGGAGQGPSWLVIYDDGERHWHRDLPDLKHTTHAAVLATDTNEEGEEKEGGDDASPAGLMRRLRASLSGEGGADGLPDGMAQDLLKKLMEDEDPAAQQALRALLGGD